MLRGPHIDTVIRRFFDENATTIRSKTTRSKWTWTLKRLQDRYPDKRINELTSENLRDFLLYETDSTPRTASGASILSYRTCLRSFFSWAEYAGLVDKDPSAILTRTVRVKAQPTRQHYWLTSDEVSDLFEACNGDPSRLRGLRDAVALGFGVFCGLRVHEISKLAWSDLNLRSAQLFVVGKGGKAATLPTPHQLVDLLADWRREATEGLGRFPGREDRILYRMQSLGGTFASGKRELQMRWGTPYGMSGVRDMVHLRGAAIGVPDLAPHDLRRTFAGILEEDGMTIRQISKMMRHGSVATTERYLEDNPARWKDNVSAAMGKITTRRTA